MTSEIPSDVCRLIERHSGAVQYWPLNGHLSNHHRANPGFLNRGDKHAKHSDRAQG